MDPEQISAQAPAQPNTQPGQNTQVVTPQAPAQPQQDVMADRTREQFEKLLASNDKLFQQNELMRQEMQERLGFTPPAAPQPQRPAAQPNAEYDFYEVDPKTGDQYINRDKLNAYMRDIQEKANRAEKTVQTYMKTAEDREIERQNKEAWSSYPELDPQQKDKFNATFYKQVRGVLTDSMLNAGEYGGRPYTFKEAADFVRGSLGQPVVPTQSQPVEQAQAANQGAALKEAGSANPQSQHQAAMSMQDAEELRALQIATRLGNTEALARRIMHSPHIKAGEES